MKLKTSNLLVLFFFILGSHYAAGQSTKRDLSQFEKGPTFDLAGEFEGKVADVKLKLRSFMIEAWRSKRMVTFAVMRYTKEGRKSVSDIYIQMDAGGLWQVVVDHHEQALRGEEQSEHELVYDTVSVGKLKNSTSTSDASKGVVILSNSKSPTVARIIF